MCPRRVFLGEMQLVDIVGQAVRSRMMAGIQSKNTKPELIVRSTLHARGFRFVLHAKNLPGKPDLVFPKHRAVLFVHGCFWHAHECAHFKWPASNAAKWRKKLEINQKRDDAQRVHLFQMGWRVCTLWECALKSDEDTRDKTFHLLERWLRGSQPLMELPR